MDGITERGRVVVIGATNRPDALDPALRRHRLARGWPPRLTSIDIIENTRGYGLINLHPRLERRGFQL